MAIRHDEAHSVARMLCDSLRDQLAEHLADINRESKSSCAIWQTENNRFAYVYHQKHTPEMRVYLRADPGFGFSVPDDAFAVLRRPSVPEKGWAREFPCYFTLDSLRQIPAAVQVLIDYAVPLATPKRRKTSDGGEKKPGFTEGQRVSVVLTRFERNRKAARICLAFFGPICQGCKQDLTKFYGEIASGLVHVHHLSPIADAESVRTIDPIQDLRPVCPNCHAVIHRRSPPYSLEELASLIDNTAK